MPLVCLGGGGGGGGGGTLLTLSSLSLRCGGWLTTGLPVDVDVSRPLPAVLFVD